MTQAVERYHWLNTIVGLLDAAFYLSDEEQFVVLDIVNKLLIGLSIPERGAPNALPAPLALEVRSSFYTNTLAGPRDSDLMRPVRAVNDEDMVVSVESWRQAFLEMLLTAYPDITPAEQVGTATVLTELLVALGVPTRAAAFFPDEVMRAYRDSPDAPWYR